MSTLTEPQFITALAERGVTVNRSQVNQFRPVAKERGDCRQYGTGRRSVWEWEQGAVEVWARYLRVRANLIAAGAWHSKRKYSAEDVQEALDEQERMNDEFVPSPRPPQPGRFRFLRLPYDIRFPYFAY